MGWGPVEWVGRVIPEAKFEEEKNASRFLNFSDLSNRYWDICKKRCLGTSWMGWGPVDWVGRLLPEAKFKIKCTSFFEFFGFERPLLRYLLKTHLHCKGSGIWVDAITQVSYYYRFRSNKNDWSFKSFIDQISGRKSGGRLTISEALWLRGGHPSFPPDTKGFMF